MLKRGIECASLTWEYCSPSNPGTPQNCLRRFCGEPHSGFPPPLRHSTCSPSRRRKLRRSSIARLLRATARQTSRPPQCGTWRRIRADCDAGERRVIPSPKERCYFPTQNLEKMASTTSSVAVFPVISPSASYASDRSTRVRSTVPSSDSIALSSARFAR